MVRGVCVWPPRLSEVASGAYIIIIADEKVAVTY